MTELAQWQIVIDGPPPPRPGQGHWSRVHKEKKRWVAHIAMAHSRRIPKCEPGERRHVSITFHRPGPPSDADNAHAACKIPLDALVQNGLIEDDRPACIELEVQTVTASRSHTLIVITRI